MAFEQMFGDRDEAVVSVDDVVAWVEVEFLRSFLAGGNRVPAAGHLNRIVVNPELEFVEFAILQHNDAAPVRVGGRVRFDFDRVSEERLRERREGVQLGACFMQQLAELLGRAVEDDIRLSFPEQRVSIHNVARVYNMFAIAL